MSDKQQEMWVRLMVLLANKGRCIYCNGAESQEVDHVIPRKGNGADHWANLVPACRACNRGKSAKGLYAWVAELTYRERAGDSGAWPHGPEGLSWMREQIIFAFDQVEARLEGVKAELDDEARQDRFLDWFGGVSKNDAVSPWRGWAEAWEAQARINGYAKSPPRPRMRITRNRLGQILEPVPDEGP